jgi:hypothetical protein
MSVPVPEYEIGRLRMEVGDVLVVKVHASLPGEVAQKIRQQITSQIPGNAPVIVIDKNVDLSILTRSEIEKRSA